MVPSSFPSLNAGTVAPRSDIQLDSDLALPWGTDVIEFRQDSIAGPSIDRFEITWSDRPQIEASRLTIDPTTGLKRLRRPGDHPWIRTLGPADTARERMS
jgi:hypothetical protein